MKIQIFETINWLFNKVTYSFHIVINYNKLHSLLHIAISLFQSYMASWSFPELMDENQTFKFS